MANKFRIKYNNNIIADNLDLNSIYTKTLSCSGKLMNGNIAIETYKVSRLPDEFQECEYIASSGAQFIDSGYVMPAGTTSVVMIDCAYTSGQDRADNNGTIGNNGRTDYGIYWNYHWTWYVQEGTSGTGISADTSRHVHIFDYPNKQYSLDGVVIASPSSFGSTPYTGLTEYIFRRHNTSGDDQNSIGQLYAWYIKSSGVYYRNMIPCYSLAAVTGYKGTTAVSCASGTIGMYDLTNSRFYINSGSGTFTKGPDV